MATWTTCDFVNERFKYSPWSLSVIRRAGFKPPNVTYSYRKHKVYDKKYHKISSIAICPDHPTRAGSQLKNS